MFRAFLFALSLLAIVTLSGACSAGEHKIPSNVIVYKSSTCPCCDGWIAHMRKAGFTVNTEVHDEDMESIKSSNGITPKLASCHTAKVGGYVIEGHVPTADIKRLLKDRPTDIIGLTAPGMPMQSPGMQAEGKAPKNFDVIAIKKDGSTERFSHY